MKEKLINIGSWAVEQAKSKGVEAESFLLHSEDLSIEVREGQVETLKEAEEMGLGIRVFKGGQMGFAFTTNLEQKAVLNAIDQAVNGARYTTSDTFNGLPDVSGNYPQVETYDPGIENTPLEAKIEISREIERVAKAYDKRIKVIEQAGYEDSRYSVAIVNSQGVQVYQKGAYCGIFIFLVAEENGDAQTGFSMVAKRHFSDLDAAMVGKEGAVSALRSLGSKGMPSRSMPCILEPYVMTNFLGVLSGSFGADAVQKGKSALGGKNGQQIASTGITLVDDGTYEKGVGSFPFDGEGWPSQRTVLIDSGIMKGLLYDAYTARKDKVISTGNGIRGSFRGLPSVSTTNLYIEPGQTSPEALRKDISRGLYVTEVMGMHTANPISGDFSVGAAGLMIENGELTYPVRGITIAGNLFDFLKDIDGTGNDLRFYGSTGSPSIRVKSLSIAGE
ncbi:MAG: TldD/PmbA family protein [Candidatus Saccharibacteria bacterium]